MTGPLEPVRPPGIEPVVPSRRVVRREHGEREEAPPKHDQHEEQAPDDEAEDDGRPHIDTLA